MIVDRIVSVHTRDEWRAWLSDHHRTEKYCWLVTGGDVPYLDTVEEALCFGWIDSTKKKLDDGRTAQRFSPRKKNSGWTELNKARVRRLEDLGLMQDAGHAVLPNMDPAAFVADEAIMTLLRQDETLYRNFRALPGLYARVRLDNIQSVKHDEPLYRSRLEKFIAHTRANKLYGQWNDNGRLDSYAT